nr:CHASE-domain containing histidine kinase 1 [Physcomitrium patens]
MHRATGSGRLGVKWWKDSGITCIKPKQKDSEAGSRYGHNWHTIAFIMWVVFMGAVSVSVYFAMRFDMLERRRENLANMCEGRARMLEEQFKASMNHVRALTALLTTFHLGKQPSAINQETFATYAERTAFERPLMSGVAYAERVLHANRNLFESKHGWTIKEMFSKEKQRDFDEYAPTTMTQETLSHLTSLDMMSGQEDRENIIRARESGKGALTNPFRLLESKHLGVVFTFAVYTTDLPEDATKEDRIKATAGYLGGAFDVETLVENLLRQMAGSQIIAVNVYDITNETMPLVMYGYTNVEKMQSTYVSDLDFGDPARRHEMRCRFKEDALPPWTAISTSIGIFVIAFLVGHMLHASRNRIDKVEENCRIFQELKMRADDAVIAKSQFLATVSHEIRTPMNGVLGMLQMLIDTPLNPAQLDYAQTALASGKALINLINEVLDQAKIESGRLEFEHVPFDLRAILDDVLSLFHGKSRASGIELAVYVSARVPKILVGDPGRFRQIITNLVGNSIKFTEAGHIFVCVHLNEDVNMVMDGSGGDADDTMDGEVESAGPLNDMNYRFNTLSGRETADYRNSWEMFERLLAQEQSHNDTWSYSDSSDVVNLVVSVEDTGVGIPLHVQDRVFTPFMQADSSTSRNYGGTGIGLSISRCLVELMSGEMGFVSRPKVGSTFTFTVELQRVPANIPERILREGRNSYLQTPPLTTCFQGMRVLVVDGRKVRCEVTRHHLKRLGLQVEVAHTVSEAAEILSTVADQGTCSSRGSRGSLAGNIEMIFVDKDAWGPGTGMNFRSLLGESAIGHLGYQSSRTSYQYRTSGRIPFGYPVIQSMKRMVLVATSMTDMELGMVKASGFVDTVVRKPLRASLIAACLKQILGVGDRSRDQEQELRSGVTSLQTLLYGKRILVVDDNPVNRKVAAGALHKYGAQVECVYSGRAAIQKLKPPHNFDACFMDVQMPEMDGFEATGLIRKAEAAAAERGQAAGLPTFKRRLHVPILAMTADVIQATSEECMRCGMDGYVAKPFDEHQLYQAVAKHFFDVN